MTTYSICPRTVHSNDISFYKRIFSFKVLNKQKTPEKKNLLSSSEKCSNKLQPKVRHFKWQHLPGSPFYTFTEHHSFNKNSKGGHRVIVWSLHVWVALQPLPEHLSEIQSLSLGPCLLLLRPGPSLGCLQLPGPLPGFRTPRLLPPERLWPC